MQNPYKITEQEDGFVFETDCGLSYKITFLKHNAFDDLGFSSYEFGFYPVGKTKRFKDQRIEDTIIFALDDFFQKTQIASFYMFVIAWIIEPESVIFFSIDGTKNMLLMLS